jgi:alpha-beta hydrolase superfamily lysophospholipase
MTTLKTTLIALAVATVAWIGTSTAHADEVKPTHVLYRTVKVDGLDIFYREAGPKNAPTVLLLHGFPTSSHMFRNLIPALADKYHVVAPDYPGYGNSSAPSVKDFEYTFDNLANVVEKFTERVDLPDGLRRTRGISSGR